MRALKRSPRRWLRPVLVGVALAPLAACNTYNQYLAHRDAITLGAGEAKEANRVAQTIDPWPPHVGNTRLTHSGKVLYGAMDRYNTDKVKEPQGLATTNNPAQANPDQGGEEGASNP